MPFLWQTLLLFLRGLRYNNKVYIQMPARYAFLSCQKKAAPKRQPPAGLQRILAENHVLEECI